MNGTKKLDMKSRSEEKNRKVNEIMWATTIKIE